MRARKFTLLSLFTVALLSLAACVIRAGGQEPWQYKIEPHAEQINRHSYVMAEIHYDNVLFSGPPQAAAVNERLLFYQELKMAQFRDMAGRYFDDKEFNGEALQNRIYFTQEESCQVFQNDGRNLSIVVDKTTSFSGEPHAMAYRYAYNFDAQSGGLLTLEDIWGEQAREKAAAAIYARIEQEGQLDEYASDLDGLLLQNLKPDHWYMEGQDIYIVYDPYDIAPYAAGIMEFALPR